MSLMGQLRVRNVAVSELNYSILASPSIFVLRWFAQQFLSDLVIFKECIKDDWIKNETFFGVA